MRANGLQRVRVRVPARPEGYEVLVGAGALSRLGVVARRQLGAGARRAALISNSKVFGLYGGTAEQSLRAEGFSVARWLMGDGERFKNFTTLERALDFLSGAGLERGDAVVALGGGVVGDLAGLASALYLRGVALVQTPTTLLSQFDSSVGGKTGVNTPAGKNLVGAFHHPRAVLVDTDTLRTLPRRELTAGWCEGLKQGAAGDRRLFDRTCAYLRGGLSAGDRARARELERVIAAQVAFKAGVVAGDEREAVSREDARSRRILNLGHTTAHALEAVTGYRRFRHGEAVGRGLIVAGEISKRLGLLAPSGLELLREAVRLCGRLPRADDLDEDEILRRVARDKKSVGGSLKWVLLEDVGRARVVDSGEIGKGILRASLRAGLSEV